MPDVPLIVLTGMGIDPFRAMFATEASQRQLNDVKLAINRAIANSVPHGEHRVLENAAHATFHVDRPDAVVQAIRDLLDRVHNITDVRPNWQLEVGFVTCRIKCSGPTRRGHFGSRCRALRLQGTTPQTDSSARRGDLSAWLCWARTLCRHSQGSVRRAVLPWPCLLLPSGPLPLMP